MANNTNNGGNGNNTTRGCAVFCDGSCGKLPKGAKPIFFCDGVLTRLSDLKTLMEKIQASINDLTNAKANASSNRAGAIDDIIVGMGKDLADCQAEYNKLIIDTVSSQLP